MNYKSPFSDIDWYCCDECRHGHDDEDAVLTHSKMLVWEGLKHLNRKSAVHEGDGPAMRDNWLLVEWPSKIPHKCSLHAGK